MADSLSVRNVDGELIARLKRCAVRHGQSVGAELRDILHHVFEGESETDFATVSAKLRRLMAGRPHTPAELLQREGRDER